ncbi:hypothetical protein TBLA_0E03970 [Henningerozyma blattae CBS 6284]|uniref:Pre-mRNA-splicing factor CWC26 n=1 Tax=Henningerozyma blattae (strain ATCC 34711 / CBS 6284 / DSM 70876 / NBRC 10599 / NRRL Y-10934 / UCD 77-7) TaxID=1071380 RepID=I2H500_HENB6|nr:hypothetical protein TBLA_0E03970 [Tetrapisispora blattae CBS 6284]CCH61452.1 hypothetical protein TBLA_0E03970 [Tetrapisispora blattae CBS 6284]
MSINDYLSKTYGPAKKEKSKKKSKKQTKGVFDDNETLISYTSAKQEQKTEKLSTLNITDSSNVTTLNNIPLSSAPTTLNSKSRKDNKNLWKNLSTNELSIQNNEPDIKKQEKSNIIKLSSGAHAGLQTAEDVEKQLKVNEESAKQLANSALSPNAQNAPTIYRDRFGRRIKNIDLQREEESSKEESRKKIQEKSLREFNMGELQKYMLDNNLKNPPSIQNASSARQKALKDLEDPLANFNSDISSISKTPKTAPHTFFGRKIYTKAYPENRFGIAPGWRWDGVDRSNGFEPKWLAKRDELETKRVEKYTMQEEF